MLSRQEPIPDTPVASGCAAAAIILAGEGEALKVCFIKRADREGDPWSGHMALPGGRTSETDLTVQRTAEREVEEEIGLNLSPELLIGRLPDLPILRFGTDTGFVLSIFVYYLGPVLSPLVPNHEVAEAFWIDLDYLWDLEHRSCFDAVYGDRHVTAPAIRVGENLIWGLTFRVLELFGQKISIPLN